MLNERRSVKALLLKGDFLMPRKYWLLLFTAAAALLFAGNGSLLITDSVESNYALTAKEMVLSGDWLSPQIYSHYWYDKPIFFYWLTALAYKMFGFTEFASRFFPALFGLGSVALLALFRRICLLNWKPRWRRWTWGRFWGCGCSLRSLASR